MNRSETRQKRVSLRNRATSAEAVLWTVLKNRQIAGLKFRRQHGIGPFVIDFYRPELRLAVELDGAVHDNPDAEEYDAARTYNLSRIAGIEVLRFENKEVFCNQELIVSSICEFKTKSTTSPSPSEGTSP